MCSPRGLHSLCGGSVAAALLILNAITGNVTLSTCAGLQQTWAKVTLAFAPCRRCREVWEYVVQATTGVLRGTWKRCHSVTFVKFSQVLKLHAPRHAQVGQADT